MILNVMFESFGLSGEMRIYKMIDSSCPAMLLMEMLVTFTLMPKERELGQEELGAG